MSAPIPCVPCCATIQTVSVPGIQGNAGTAGTDGISPYSIVAGGGFADPGVGNPVVVTFDAATPTSWMVEGQTVIIGQNTNLSGVLANPGPYTFTVTVVTNLTTATLTRVASTTDGVSATVDAGAICSAVGPSGAAPAAIVPIISTQAGLSQTITAGWLQVGTIHVDLVTSGINYLYFARVTVNWTGVTFVASRDISIRIQNATQATTLATSVRPTGIQTTTTFPSSDYTVSFLLDNTGNAADVIQLQIMIDVVNSAGTLNVTAGSLCAIPLA